MPPRTAVTKKGGKRRYVRDIGGEQHEYVNITGCTSKWGEGGWKVPYGAKAVAECAVEAFETGKMGALLELDRDQLLCYLKGATSRDRDGAAAKGTAVHDAWESYLKSGSLPDIEDPMVAEMVGGLLILMEKYQVEWERSEQTVFNDTHGWAGTMDGIVTIQFPGEDKRRRCVCDIKTSRSVNNPPKHEYAMQLAALAHGEVIVHDNGTEESMPEVDEVGVIFHVRPGYAAVVPVRADDSTYEDFLVCIAMTKAERGADDRVTFMPVLGDPDDDTMLLTERKEKKR